jgi:hypothetical protein
MCKQTCCPGSGHTSGGGLGAAAAVIVILIIAAAARSAAHAALAVLHAVIIITVITAAVLAGLAVLAVAVLVIRRARRARLPVTAHRPVTWQARPQAVMPAPPAPVDGHAPLALPAPHQIPVQQGGADPEQVAAIVAAVLRDLP